MGNIVELFSQHQDHNSATSKTPTFFSTDVCDFADKRSQAEILECELVDEIYPKEKRLQDPSEWTERGQMYQKVYTRLIGDRAEDCI